MSKNIKVIHVGLPETLVNRVIWVEDDFRINELSHQPGGCDVVIEYANNNIFGYNRVKRPSEYIRQILVHELADGDELTFDSFDEKTQLELTKQIINTAHIRVNTPLSEISPSAFEQIWNSKSSEITLLAALQPPDNFEIEKPDGIKTMKLMISEINKSKSGVSFNAKCWEVHEHDIIGRTIYCRFRTKKPLRSEFYVATNRIAQIVTKAGLTVWVVK